MEEEQDKKGRVKGRKCGGEGRGGGGRRMQERVKERGTVQGLSQQGVWVSFGLPGL